MVDDRHLEAYSRKLRLLDSITGSKRVAFAYNSKFNVAGRAAILDTQSLGMACNAPPVTPPGLIATVRAGSEVVFRWSDWIPSHRGPITTWLAPYQGDVSKANVNNLDFIKIHEAGLYDDMTWSTDKLLSNNGSWPVTLPWDINPGTYILRHELLALHFATPHSNYKKIGGIVSPQFYMSCYNLNITGTGTAKPLGVKFPGAYKRDDPGVIFDIFVNNTNYPIPGPKVYQPSGMANPLKPNPQTVVSPLGNPDADALYRAAMETELAFFGSINNAIYKAGG
jgi:hypothetical protein